MKEYHLIVDAGKPDETIFLNKEDLFNKLLDLDCLSTTKENPYIDIIILDENDKNITEKIFKEYNFKKEKVGFLK